MAGNFKKIRVREQADIPRAKYTTELKLRSKLSNPDALVWFDALNEVLKI